MISDSILDQIQGGPRSGISFVAEASDIEAIASTVCAFLNTNGGAVFVGVDPSGKVLGIEDDPEEARRGLEKSLQVKIAPRALFTLSIDVVDLKSIISIECPEGRDKPYVVDGRVFVRDGKKSVMADPPALRQLIQSRSVEAERWERRLATGLLEEDLDPGEVVRTLEDAEHSQRMIFDNKDILSVLRQLNMVAVGGFTNGCDVLFARRQAVRLPQCRVRFVQFESTKTGSSYLDDVWLDGPLVDVYLQLIELVSSHVRIQAYFDRNKDTRREGVNYSIEALREGLVNALVHRDYSSFSGGVLVAVYPNRIEIWNSGRLPAEIRVVDLKKTHPSIPTNPDIAHVLYLRRLMERVGRGTQKIIAACQELGAKPPMWQDNASGVTLTIYSAGDVEGISLNPRQLAAMERLRPGDVLLLWDYVEEQRISERQARRDLADLENAGLLIRQGRARATRYQRTDRTL